MRIVLTIEYHYARALLNSIAMDAIFHRFEREQGRSIMTTPLVVKPEEDYAEGIQAVVDSTTKLLRIVLDELLPDQHLKHLPVRTYSRVFTGIALLWKASYNCLLVYMPPTLPY